MISPFFDRFLVAMVFVVGAPLRAQPTWTAVRGTPIDTWQDSVPPLDLVPRMSALGPDGNLYLTSWKEMAILVFTPEGRRLRRIGRIGRGPGEFIVLTAYGFVHDTIWCYDGKLALTTYFN